MGRPLADLPYSPAGVHRHAPPAHRRISGSRPLSRGRQRSVEDARDRLACLARLHALVAASSPSTPVSWTPVLRIASASSPSPATSPAAGTHPLSLAYSKAAS